MAILSSSHLPLFTGTSPEPLKQADSAGTQNRALWRPSRHPNACYFRLHRRLLCDHLHTTASYRLTTRGGFFTEEDDVDDRVSFQEAVALFNSRDYYRCHDVLEALWNQSEDPARTLFHGILQCAVGFHHLFNQNHRGAMMELGEGLCKLRKLNFEGGPFHEFEKEIAAVLDFIYQTQLELAACTDDFCIALDQSERSYQLLGGFAAGERLYYLDNENAHILFCPQKFHNTNIQAKIKVPVLRASEDHLVHLE